MLADSLNIDEQAAKIFIIRQCDQMGLIGLEISFYHDMKMEDVLFRLEDYAIKLIDFVHSITDFPSSLMRPATTKGLNQQSKLPK